MEDADKLKKLVRDNPEHYHFLRETPRAWRDVPFATDERMPTLEESLLSVVMVVAFVAFAYWVLGL